MAYNCGACGAVLNEYSNVCPVCGTVNQIPVGPGVNSRPAASGKKSALVPLFGFLFLPLIGYLLIWWSFASLNSSFVGFSIPIGIAAFVVSIIGARKRYSLHGFGIAGIPLSVVHIITYISLTVIALAGF